MQRRSVDSSLIASISYDEERRLLELALRSGRRYRYFDVPELAYRRLLAAPSIGAHFNAHIRDVYQYIEVTLRG
jgi:lysyl-tRNA synthetase class 2